MMHLGEFAGNYKIVLILLPFAYLLGQRCQKREIVGKYASLPYAKR